MSCYVNINNLTRNFIDKRMRCLLASMLMVENKETSVNKELLPRRRVVVTGMGMVTPLGLNVAETWKNLIDGKSGIIPIESKYTKVKVAGQIKDFDPTISGVLIPKDLKKVSHPAQLSVAAAFEALTNAGLLGPDKKILPTINAENVGVKIGTGIGGATEIAEVGERLKKDGRISPFAALLIEPERVASVVSIKFGLKGPLATPVAACATGNISITLGYQDIALGEADIMVVGGAESMFYANEVGFGLYSAVGALSEDADTKASRPFHKTRNGFVMGEGAGVLVLEEYEHAKKRGAKILVELVGYKNTSDAGSDTEPSGEGAERAMRGALKKAGEIAEKGIIYVNAHATSTPVGDRKELEAINGVLKNRDSRDFHISSTKGATGHLMGAAGAVEAIFCIKALEAGIVPPTINLDDSLEEGEGVNLVPIDAQRKKIDVAVNNGFGFGGINSTTVFAIPED